MQRLRDEVLPSPLAWRPCTCRLRACRSDLGLLLAQEDNAEELAEQRGQVPEGAAKPANGHEQEPGKEGAPGKKRKAGKDQTAEDVLAKHAKRAAKAKEQGQQWFDLKQNTSVYVTGLPTDVTEPELAEVSLRCCGVLAWLTRPLRHQVMHEQLWPAAQWLF